MINDGVTIARAIELSNAIENAGVPHIQELAFSGLLATAIHSCVVLWKKQSWRAVLVFDLLYDNSTVPFQSDGGCHRSSTALDLVMVVVAL